MKRSQRKTCKTCGQPDVAHYDDVPHGTHVKSERHQNALRAAEPPSSGAAAHRVIAGAAGERSEGHVG